MSDRAAVAIITRVVAGVSSSDQDLVAVEAPLAVDVRAAGNAPITRSLGILMRTPGDDEELALGLLRAEGIIDRRQDVSRIQVVAPTETGGQDLPARVEVELVDAARVRDLLERAQLATSACGLCGRLELQSVTSAQGPAHVDRPALDARVISGLPDALRRSQSVFAETGGLHAAALFDPDGTCMVSREDVGRHNAVDKVVGWAIAHDRLPARDAILAVSGRVAYEIVQKAVMAGIAVIVAVGAPSSLAVDAARAARLTLIGFVRGERFNVYAGAERLR